MTMTYDRYTATVQCDRYRTVCFCLNRDFRFICAKYVHNEHATLTRKYVLCATFMDLRGRELGFDLGRPTCACQETQPQIMTDPPGPNIIDKAYAWFVDTPGIRIQEQTSGAIFRVNVQNATAASPLQVPLACNFCGTETPMTGETYMRLTRGRATAAGPQYR